MACTKQVSRQFAVKTFKHQDRGRDKTLRLSILLCSFSQNNQNSRGNRKEYTNVVDAHGQIDVLSGKLGPYKERAANTTEIQIRGAETREVTAHKKATTGEPA